MFGHAMELCARHLSAVCISLMSISLHSWSEGVFQIESETDEYSAEIHIGLRNGDTSVYDKMKGDRKRTVLGIGETVSLTITDKEDHLKHSEEFEWRIKEGGDLITLKVRPTNTSAELAVNESITHEGTVTIKVVCPLHDEPAKIQFSILRPSGITGNHAKVNPNDPMNPDRGTPSNKSGMAGDGDVDHFGASAILELTIEPTNVGFANISIKEPDMGIRPIPSPSLAGNHQPNPNAVKLNQCNQMQDHIGMVRHINMIQKDPITGMAAHELPQSWSWLCSWQTSHGYRIKEVSQIFTVLPIYHLDRPFRVDAQTTISKFGCSMTRESTPGNIHQFTP